MTRPRNFDRWLKAYPPAWRDRYGDELSALVEDQAAGGRITVGLKLSIITGGLAERWRTEARPTVQLRQRSGSVLVLCAWCAFVIAGVNFAKFSEHWQSAVAPQHRHVAAASYAIVQWGALAASVLVVLGAVLVGPALVRFVHRDGWRELRLRFRIPVAITLMTGFALAGVVTWAHRLDIVQRGGADGAYAAAVAGFSLLAAICLSSWTAAAAQVVFRLDLSAAVVRAEATLAATLTGLMAAMGAAVVVWWASMASRGQAFFPSGGGSYAASGSALAPAMIVTVALMGVALVLAFAGVSRTLTRRRA